MQKGNHCNLSNYNDIRVCTDCGETDFQKLTKTSTIVFDLVTGTFEAGGVEGYATDITDVHVNITSHKTKRMCMRTKNGDVITMESNPKRGIFGYGKIGKEIDRFHEILPELVEAAKKHAARNA